MVPHMVYFDILVTIQRQFIDVQYRDTSKVENMVRIGVCIYTNIAKTAIASLYFQSYNPISYSGHPRGSQKYRFAKMWGGCTRVISECSIFPNLHHMIDTCMIPTFKMLDIYYIKYTYSLIRSDAEIHVLFCANLACKLIK